MGKRSGYCWVSFSLVGRVMVGIMKEYAEQFYKSKAWERCRASYAASVGGLCEECLKHGRIEAGVIVHHKIHITPANIHCPELTMNFDNLELLCRKCHGEMHGTVKRRYKVDPLGRVLVTE